ncbi:MAG TPA: hypothetical protein V6D03_13315, partial [Candidatus Caenarcaniphilales bacterium]
LDLARTAAQDGSTRSLSTAIAQAQGIAPSSPRWQEAQAQINQWMQEIQTREDQPALDHADELASRGDLASLQSAIKAAKQIKSGRPLYQEAQNKIEDWAGQIQAASHQQPDLSQPELASDIESQQLMQTALNLVAQGTPQAFVSAIETINQISSSSPLRIEADQAIDQWSQQILELARQQAINDPLGAIAIAQQVPRFTPAYAEAQFEIQAWKVSN